MIRSMRWVSVAFIAALAGCHTVAPVPSPWATYIRGKQPSTVWLTKTNHTLVRVDGPRVFNDTIVGAVDGQYTEIALSDVSRVSAMKKDNTKTILAASAGGAATLAALYIIFQGQGTAGPPPPPCDPDTPCGPGTP